MEESCYKFGFSATGIHCYNQKAMSDYFYDMVETANNKNNVKQKLWKIIARSKLRCYKDILKK